MRRFGPVLGIAALAHLLGLWGVGIPALLLIGIAIIAICVVLAMELKSGPLAFGRELTRSPDAPYASWLAATVVIISSLMHAGAGVAMAVWSAGAVLSTGFALLGVPSMARDWRDIDLAHIAWFAPLLVAGLDAGPDVVAPLRDAVGWAGFAGMLVVLGASTHRAITHHAPHMRSPWYAIGGGAIMSLWCVDALKPDAATMIAITLGCAALFWVVRIAQNGGWWSQGAWSNLFSLCSVAALALRLNARPIAVAFTLAACVVALMDVARTFCGWRRNRRLDASRLGEPC